MLSDLGRRDSESPLGFSPSHSAGQFRGDGRTVYEREPATPSVRIAGTMEMEEGRSRLRTSAQGELGQSGRWRAPPVATQPHPHASRETPAWQPRSESRMPKDTHWLAILGHFRNRELWPTKPPSDSLRVPDLPIMPLRPLLLPLPPRLPPPPTSDAVQHKARRARPPDPQQLHQLTGLHSTQHYLSTPHQHTPPAYSS